MQIKELFHQLVIEVSGGRSWHELLNHEADLIGIDHRLGWNRPTGHRPKPLRQDDGLSSKLSTPGPRVPLHNDRPTTFPKELVSPCLAAAKPAF